MDSQDSDSEHDRLIQEDTGPDDAAVHVQSMYAWYNTTQMSLRGVDLTLQTGKVLVLLGASGAGKSSLLKALIGQVQATARVFLLLGRPQLEMSRSIGYMPQVSGLISDLTVSEMWESFGQFYGMSPKEIETRTIFLLDHLGLKQQARQLCSTLSGGQTQRTSLGIALMPSPPLLILDEPMTGLDPVLRQKLWEHLKMLARVHGTTVVMASQFFELACEADEVAIMHEGLLLTQDTPVRLVKHWGQPQQASPHEDDTPATEATPSSEAVLITSETMGMAYDNLCQQYEHVRAADIAATGVSSYRQHFDCPMRDMHEHETEQQNTDVGTSTELDASQSRPAGEWMPQKRANAQEEHKILGIRPYICRSIVKTHTRSYFRFIARVLLLFISPVLEMMIYQLMMGNPVKRIEVGVFSMDRGYDIDGVHQFLGNETLRLFEHKNDYRIVHLECNTPTCGSSVADTAVRDDGMVGAVYFKKKYSEMLMTATDVENDMHFQMFLDTSTPVIAAQISEDFYHAFEETKQNHGKRTRDILSFVKPVFGDLTSRFSVYILAGLVGMTPLVNGFVISIPEMTKREEDETHTRYRVAGITDREFVVGNVLGFSSIHWPQSLFLLIVFMFGFGFDISFTAFLALLLVVTALVCVSQLLSVVSGLLVQSQFDAMLLMMTWFMPCMLLCGLYWPLEAQPYYFRWISLLMPSTWGVSSFRAFVLKSGEAGMPCLIGMLVLCTTWSLLLVRYAVRLNHRKTKRVEL